MATKTEQTLYLRNARPNMLAFHYAGERIKLEHRGHRADSVALPIEALNDGTIARWLNIGQLERIRKEDFMKLGTRRVDVLPNPFLLTRVRGRNNKGELELIEAGKADPKLESNTARDLTHIDVKKVAKTADPSPRWAGELMTTAEEMEDFEEQQAHHEYPSHHREDTRQQGY